MSTEVNVPIIHINMYITCDDIINEHYSTYYLGLIYNRSHVHFQIRYS